MSLIAAQGGGMYDNEGTGTAGTPGTWTGGLAPQNFSDLQGAVASPLTAWTANQRVVLADNTAAYWNGTAWVRGWVGATNAAPTFVNQTMPATGTVGVAYAGYTFTATGDATITFSIAPGGQLPNGLTLASGGALSGTPTAPPGVYNFKVRATNPAGITDTATKTITIS